jgi:hypothetical protein
MSGLTLTLPNEEEDDIPFHSILWRGILLPGYEAYRLFSRDSHSIWKGQLYLTRSRNLSY